jgi:hypothetical protein
LKGILSEVGEAVIVIVEHVKIRCSWRRPGRESAPTGFNTKSDAHSLTFEIRKNNGDNDDVLKTQHTHDALLCSISFCESAE